MRHRISGRKILTAELIGRIVTSHQMKPTIEETAAMHTTADGRVLLFRSRRALWIWLRKNESEALS